MSRAEILARRASLLERAEADRVRVAEAYEPWRTPIAVVDRGLALISFVRRTAPLLGLGFGITAAALAVIRPPRIGDWARKGLQAARFAQRVAELF